MAEKVTAKLPEKLLHFDNIKFDLAIQPRVEMDMEYANGISERLIVGDRPPPVHVFYDGQYYWLADGFHRWTAAKMASILNPSLADINCVVHEGSRRDAMIYATGANVVNSKAMTPADKEKAARVLFADEEWSKMSNKAIADHLHVGGSFVEKCRRRWCIEQRIEYPEFVVTADGKQRASGSAGRKPKGFPPRPVFDPRAGGHVITDHRGASTTIKDSKAAADEARRVREEAARRRALYCFAGVQALLRGNVVNSERPRRALPGVDGAVVEKKVAVTWMKGGDDGDVAAALGRALIIVHEDNCVQQSYVLCERPEDFQEFSDVQRRYQVRLITPEDFAVEMREVKRSLN